MYDGQLWSNKYSSIFIPATHLLRENRPCLLSFKFPQNWNIINSQNYWSSVNTIVIYILDPYFEGQREKLNLLLAQKGLVFLDNFEVRQTETAKFSLKSQGLEFF